MERKSESTAATTFFFQGICDFQFQTLPTVGWRKTRLSWNFLKQKQNREATWAEIKVQISSNFDA